ncbi:MAG: hypothetical protein AB1552_00205 [Nitrospirota bacterium]
MHPLKSISFFLLVVLAGVFCHLPYPVCAEGNSIDTMRDETLSYFNPLTGTITAVEGRNVSVDLGTKELVKAGMRFHILRETAPFRHPVTKEPLGRLESLVGILEIREVHEGFSSGEVIKGETQEGDKIRISGNRIPLLFCQAKGIDWYLADSYYRKLKETGRFTILDTAIETEDPVVVIEEAKRLQADVALLLAAEATESGTILVQRLFWVSDGLKFAEIKTSVDTAHVKELRFGEEFFTTHRGQATLSIDLPSDAKLMIVSDTDGDGTEEIVFGSEKVVKIYTLGVDLQPAHGGLRIEGSSFDDFIWLDSVDLNRNGRDEIIITSMKGEEIVSSIYEMKGAEFVLLYQAEVFMRRVDNRLLAQAYARDEGFSGDVYEILWDGEYKKGSPEKLPRGVNIYDFCYVDNTMSDTLLVAYDEDGFISVYDGNRTKIWRSKTGTGGFLTSFKRKSPSGLVDKGEWAVKDRLLSRNREVLSVKRIPLFSMVQGLGYKKSQIVSFWWNGLSMEEKVLIDNIGGTVFDYLVSGDKIIVLASPLLGIKPGNILKGENPIKTELHIYSLKGM